MEIKNEIPITIKNHLGELLYFWSKYDPNKKPAITGKIIQEERRAAILTGPTQSVDLFLLLSVAISKKQIKNRNVPEFNFILIYLIIKANKNKSQG